MAVNILYILLLTLYYNVKILKKNTRSIKLFTNHRNAYHKKQIDIMNKFEIIKKDKTNNAWMLQIIWSLYSQRVIDKNIHTTHNIYDTSSRIKSNRVISRMIHR